MLLEETKLTILRGPLSDPEFKGQFSGHETFPIRHGWLKKVYDAFANAKDTVPSTVFSPDIAISHFGVGKNMVAAMRHWSLVTGVIMQSGVNEFHLTDFGKLLFSDDGIDPYLEDKGTLWLIHWRIASNAVKATTAYWAFNHFVHGFLDRETLNREIGLYASQSKKNRATATTIKKDIDCFFRTYLSGSDRRTSVIEDTLECPLSELELIIPSAVKGQYEFRRGPQPSLPDWVLLFALSEFWGNRPEAETISLEALTFEPGSPGRVFKIDEHSLAERLSKVETVSNGSFRWTDTAGLAQIVRVERGVSPIGVLKSQHISAHTRAAA
jgi:hypothetical protein